MEEIAEGQCLRHPFDWHVLVHEAGHAAMAVHHGITFAHVAVHGDTGGPTFDGGLRRAAAAVVFSSSDHSVWARPDKAASLQFVWAGKLAEMELLKDAMADSEFSDMAAWREGVGLSTTITYDELDRLIGCSAEDLLHDTEAWMADNVDSVDRLAKHLSASQAVCPDIRRGRGRSRSAVVTLAPARQDHWRRARPTLLRQLRSAVLRRPGLPLEPHRPN